MARRIEVTPRSDGAIIIECAGEEVEVVIKEPPRPPKPTRTTKPITDPRRRHILLVPVTMKDDNEVIEWITEQHQDPQVDEFAEIMLTRRRLNVHKMGQFVDRLHDRLPDVGVHLTLLPDKDLL